MKIFEPIRRIAEGIRETYYDISDVVKNPSVLGYLALTPTVALALSCLFGLIHWIRFIVARGYQTQIKNIKINGLNEAFTSGTVPDYYNLPFCIVLGLLVFIGFVVAFIKFFREEKTWRKILTTVIFVLCIGTLGVGCADMIVEALRGVGFIPGQLHEPFRKFAQELDFDDILVLVSIALMICFIVLMRTSCVGEFFTKAFIALLVSFAGAPLILLLLENFIALIIVGVLAIGLFIFFGLFAASAGGSDASSGSTEDCIYVENLHGEKKYVCSVREFEKGEVAIYNKEDRITDIAGCKPPER